MALSDQLLNSALDLAARGFRVFPLKSGAKTPAHRGWQDEATAEAEIVGAWWSNGHTYNIGVLMGRGLVAVDIDVKSGKPGAESFKALGLSAEERDTFRVKTASGGWHVYYATEDDFGNSPGDLGPGIDVRGGGRGYVVGPGSVLTNGSGEGVYRIDHDAPVRSLPERVRVRLRGHNGPVERSILPLVDLDTDDACARAVSFLETAALAVEGQNGDLTTYKVAAQLKDFGVSKETAFELMDAHWNDRCSPPWELEALKEKVENAYLYGTKPPASDHPAAVFGGVDVDRPDRVPSPDASPWYRHGDPWERNVRWLFHGVLPAVGVGVIVGPPQAGKTFVNIELGRAVAAGKPFFGVQPDNRGGVAFLFAGTEGSALPMRLDALGEHGRLPISSRPVSDLSARGALGKLLEDLRSESARMQRNFGFPLRLVILETLSASGLLVDENNNSEIGLAFANLGTLARELDCLVLTTHHPPKSGGGERGGSAIRASADYILEITREGTDHIRRLDITKARDAEQRALGTFTLLPVSLGLDDRGREITSMTVSSGEPIARSGRRAQHMDIFMTSLDFAIMESDVTPHGHKAAEWDDVCKMFRDLKPGSKDKSNVNVAFKKCVDYAKDTGAVDSAILEGVRYIWMKEIVDV